MEATISEWQDLFAKLDGFATLSEGWNSYAAPAPAPPAIAAARSFLTLLQREQYLPTRIAPSVMGGVGITHRQDGRKVYVEFYNDGTAHALFSSGREGMDTRKVSTDTAGLRQLLVDMRNYLNG
jgi:hypothetical protein